MKGFTVTGFTILGIEITGLICDKINVPVMMQVGSRIEGSMQQIMMNSDVYCVLDIEQKLHFMKPDEIAKVVNTGYAGATMEFVKNQIRNEQSNGHA